MPISDRINKDTISWLEATLLYQDEELSSQENINNINEKIEDFLWHGFSYQVEADWEAIIKTLTHKTTKDEIETIIVPQLIEDLKNDSLQEELKNVFTLIVNTLKKLELELEKEKEKTITTSKQGLENLKSGLVYTDQELQELPSQSRRELVWGRTASATPEQIKYVMSIQQLLLDLWLVDDEEKGNFADGIYGPKTRTITRKLQEEINKTLPISYKKLTVDGLAGPDTKNALFVKLENWMTVLEQLRKNQWITTGGIETLSEEEKWTTEEIEEDKIEKGIEKIEEKNKLDDNTKNFLDTLRNIWYPVEINADEKSLEFPIQKNTLEERTKLGKLFWELTLKREKDNNSSDWNVQRLKAHTLPLDSPTLNFKNIIKDKIDTELVRLAIANKLNEKLNNEQDKKTQKKVRDLFWKKYIFWGAKEVAIDKLEWQSNTKLLVDLNVQGIDTTKEDTFSVNIDTSQDFDQIIDSIYEWLKRKWEDGLFKKSA